MSKCGIAFLEFHFDTRSTYEFHECHVELVANLTCTLAIGPACFVNLPLLCLLSKNRLARKMHVSLASIFLQELQDFTLNLAYILQVLR